MLSLAKLKPSDLVYDLGCGNASILIFAAEQFHVAKSIGFENMPQRIGLARKNIAKHGLGGRIIIERDMYEADLSKADVIIDTMPEGDNDFKDLYSKNNMRDDTRLIKHDLPLLGFLPDKVDFPFYRMTYPLKKAKNPEEWASTVLGRKNVKPKDVWHELYYYSHNRTYTKSQIETFHRILLRRLS
jgi:hypothetical protein